MQMRKFYCSTSFALDLAHEKFDVWNGPKRQAQLVCNTPDSLSCENKYLERVFHKNNYDDGFIERNIYRPTDINANLTPTTTATIPYIKGMSETIDGSYSPTTFASHTNLWQRYDIYWLT